jgi:hypothetical protein
MIVTKEALPFVAGYIDAVNEGIKKLGNPSGLSRIQCAWLRFVLLAMLLTNSLCWARFERSGLGAYSAKALSWLFVRAKIAWEIILCASVCHIIDKYGIRRGRLVIDDTDNERSKTTTQIAKTHKIKDKRTGGYFNGQNIVFLLLVSKELTIPLSFRFFEPDPALRAWRIEDVRLRLKDVAKQDRPVRPERDPNYPKKWQLALSMIEEFKERYPKFMVDAVIADSAYGNKDFAEAASKLIARPQVISQIAKTQLVNVEGKYMQAGSFFESCEGVEAILMLRGNETKVTYVSRKLKVKAHGKKCWVIALKYEDEKEYRYLIATDMTWNDIDVIKTYAARWLVEVFIQDWKSYEGWAQLAKQRGIDGSNHGVILSLLCDHMLYFHDANLVSFESKKRAVTVGSIRNKILIESLMSFIKNIVESDDPKQLLSEFTETASKLFELRESTKHLRGCYGPELADAII